MDTSFIKKPGFWAALVMTNIGLLLSNGYLGSGELAQTGGWIITILTVLGVHALADKPATPAQ